MDGFGPARRSLDEAARFGSVKDHLVHEGGETESTAASRALTARIREFPVIVNKRQIFALVFLYRFSSHLAGGLYAETGRTALVKAEPGGVLPCHFRRCLLERRLAAASRLACTAPQGEAEPGCVSFHVAMRAMRFFAAAGALLEFCCKVTNSIPCRTLFDGRARSTYFLAAVVRPHLFSRFKAYL